MFDQFKPINPKTERLKKRLLIGVPLALILCGYLYYEFKNYAEERAVSQFLTTVMQQDYRQAYELWQPSRYGQHTDEYAQNRWELCSSSNPSGSQGRLEI